MNPKRYIGNATVYGGERTVTVPKFVYYVPTRVLIFKRSEFCVGIFTRRTFSYVQRASSRLGLVQSALYNG